MITAECIPANMRVKSGMAFHSGDQRTGEGELLYIHTGVHDLNTDKVGAVEVPVAAVAHLPPLRALPRAGRLRWRCRWARRGLLLLGAFNAPGTFLLLLHLSGAPAAASLLRLEQLLRLLNER